MSKKYKILIIFSILITIIVITVSKKQDSWMLSLYGNGQTTMRLKYSSKEECLSSGRSYMFDKFAERFDCGYKCESFNIDNLQDSPVCNEVCNEGGCR